MKVSAFKLLLFFALLNVFAAKAEEDESPDSSFVTAATYGSSLKSGSKPSGRFSSRSQSSDDFSSGSQSSDDFSSSLQSSDTTPEEPSPPSSSALASIGPLLSLIQPILGGILNGPGETEYGATYPPLLKPFFSPLPILPGFGIIPASIAAQASDLVASAAASARGLFANAARENALRSQANYGHILTALNELNMPAEESESRK